MRPSTFLAIIAAVKARPLAGTFRLLCLCILLALPAAAWAQTYSLAPGGSADVLTLTYPGKAAPPVVRTGARRVEVLFPEGAKPRPGRNGKAPGALVAGLSTTDNVLVIETKDDAFGFVASPKGAGLQVQFFKDAMGSRWKPPGEPEAAPAQSAPAAQPAQPAQAPQQAQAPPSEAQAPQPSSEIKGTIGQGGTPVPQAQATQTVQQGQPAQQSQPVQQGQPAQQTPAASAPQPSQNFLPPMPGVPAMQPGPGQPPSPGAFREATPAPSTPVQAAPATPAAPAAPAQSSSAQPVQQGLPAAPAPAAAPASTLSAPVGQPPASSAPAPAPSAAGAPVQAPVQDSGQQTPSSVQAPVQAPVQQTPVQAPAQSGQVGQNGQPQQSPPSPAAPAPQPVQPSGQAPAAPPGQGEPAAPASEAPGTVKGSISFGQPQAPATQQAAPAAETPKADPAALKGTIGASSAPSTPEGAAAQPGQPQSGQAPAQEAPALGKTDEAAMRALSPGQDAAAQPPAPAATPGEAPAEGHKGDSMEDTAFFISGEQAFAKEDYAKARSVAETLLQKPELSKDLREGALYMRAESLFNMNKSDLAGKFVETGDALQEALNYNTTSMRVPRALIKLGYLNLRQGNIPEARAYFNLLARKYPLDEEVPLIDVYWGEHYMEQAKRGDADANFEKAAQSFRTVLSKYPESRFARDAALGLSRAQLELRQYEEAAKIIDYIDKRWPRYYIENPVMRRVAADVAYKLGEFEKAREDYLWFYNLVPKDQSNDLVLSRLGDVNLKLGKRDAAREFYDMAIRLYPGQEGALMSMMRLAEQGIHDAPTMQEMFKAFADPNDIRPDKIYEIIANEFPKSPLAPLALLKLAMWRLYKEQYPETLDLASRFVKTYPKDELAKQAEEVGAQAFAKMVGTLLGEMNYKRILELWRAYPFLANRMDQLPDLERLGVALAMYYQGAPKEALALAAPYLDKGPTPDAQKALALMLTIYRENQDWQGVLDTLAKVSSWKLAEGPRRALEFAQAMALEHTGQQARSRLLWARLAADQELDPAKRAYAVYYQARTAYERQDYDKALVWAMDSRTLFKEAAKDDGKARDALLLMIEANQAAGRYREALGLCAQFEAEAPEGGAEWGANRLRMAKLNKLLGDEAQWRKILTDLRDSMGGSLYGKLAASELAAKGIEDRAGRLAGPP